MLKICRHHGELTQDLIRICDKRKSKPAMLCKLCLRERAKKSREKNPERERERRKKQYLKYQEKYIQYSKEYRQKNPEKVKLSRQLYGINKKENVKDAVLKYKFNMTFDQYNEMLIKQNGVCAICFKQEVSKAKNRDYTKNLAVDHCHTTGKIRGLLCEKCNQGLGRFNDSIILLQNAIKYLSV